MSKPTKTFLAGDVGGTKVNLAFCEVEGERIEVRFAKRYSSAKYAGLGAILKKYISEIPSGVENVEHACFGVPGHVLEGRCKTVNLPWMLDERELRKEMGFKSVHLINDLAAMAHGVCALKKGDGYVTLHEGEASNQKDSNQALLAAGTGLGEALLFWDGKQHVVSASEGGHCDFGPQDDEQIELLRWLWPRHKHVSVEHVASGPGIHRIFRFLSETGREKVPADLAAQLSAPDVDASPLIAQSALEKRHLICVRTMNLWLFLLGAEAGNLALKTLCFGGLFLGGGVVPHVLDLFREPSFLKGFTSKGRMSELVRRVPIQAITDQHTALYGAALAALSKL